MTASDAESRTEPAITPAADLVARSNRLGADPRNTNYAGGNTSAKGSVTDPVTRQPVDLVWVKGSGGDLGTLTESGLAVLRLDRLRALVDVYPGVDREDEMVAAFDFCLHGKGGAAPSIDTAMHGLVDAPHVDHLHPDSGIALATAADGEAADQGVLRRPGRVGAVAASGLPARTGHRRDRQGEPAGHRLRPRRPRHHSMGCDQRGVRGEQPRDHPDRRAVPRRARQQRAVRPGRDRLRSAPGGRATGQRRGSRPGHPRAGVDGRADGRALHRRRRRPGLLLAGEAAAAGRARHLVPGPLPADQGPAARPRHPGHRLARGRRHAAEGAARRLPRRLRRLLRPARDAGLPADARRRPGDRAGARRRDVLLRREQADRPGGGRVLHQRDQRDARRGGGLHLRPDRGEREVPHRVLGPRGGQARRACPSRSRSRPGSRS